MKTTYNKTLWEDNKTPLNASNLNNIENGIEGLYNNALSFSNLQEGPGIKMDGLEGGDIRVSWALHEIFECPDNEYPGTLGEYYKDTELGILYFCLGPGNWIKLNYEQL